MAEAFPDWRWDIEEMLAVDDKVITRYVARGTHRGEYMGAAPTGKEVAFTGINISRLEGGKIVESWGNSDQLGCARSASYRPRSPSEDPLQRFPEDTRFARYIILAVR